jgi:hypothetical protein
MEESMHNQKIFRYVLLLTLLVAMSLSCKTITGPLDKLKGIATDVEDMIGIATDINIEGIVTDIDIEGMKTEIAPMITEVLDMVTEMPDLTGDKPTDVPIIEGGEELMSSKGLITYTTDKELREVVSFYQTNMPANGWVKGEEKIEEDTAELVFQKDTRKATISIDTIPFMGTTVSITIEGG